jgi:hypothetical protein
MSLFFFLSLTQAPDYLTPSKRKNIQTQEIKIVHCWGIQEKPFTLETSSLTKFTK